MLGFRLPTGHQIALAPGATIALEINNALLAEADNNGSYTLPVTAPRTPANEIALRFAGLLDSPGGPQRRIESVEAFDDDELLAVGTLLLLKVTPATFELSLLTGISAVMAKLKGRKLRDFVFGGQRLVASTPFVPLGPEITAHMMAVAAQPEDYDYVFAPVSNNDFLADNAEDYPRRANLNAWHTNGQGQGGHFVWSTGYFPPTTPVPGLPVQPFPGYYPDHQYSFVPFPKLAYVVRTLLAELGIPFEEDFFDDETETLAIIGNTAIDDLVTNRDYRTLDFQTLALSFRIGDCLPDLTAHELLRKVADTFFLELSVSPIGRLRLRRTDRLLALPPAAVLTARAAPGYSIDVPADEPPALATAYVTDRDGYAQTRYQAVDPALLGAAVATVATLPAQPGLLHEIRLVEQERAYYQHDGTAWAFFSVQLDTVTVGPAGDTPTAVPQGIDLVLEEEMRSTVALPAPGTAWPPSPGQDPAFAVLRAGVFGERGYSPTANALGRSPALRLGFYRGMQPYKNPAQGSFPLLTQYNTDLQGGRLGNYTLRLDGPDGTVARWGQAVLEARRIGDVVSWPVWLTAEQVNQLDTGRRHEIDGVHVLIKKINVTFPIRKPAELQLVVLRPKAVLQ